MPCSSLPLPLSPYPKIRGFTLIELSIVLVIIGLIVGGVLVGRDLVSAAAVRAQISQIEKLQTAIATFYSKYGWLPGDIPATPATQFGFTTRGPYAGQGDGNGILDGTFGNYGGANSGTAEGEGETAAFWTDLGKASLIEGNFLGSPTGNISSMTTGINRYLPPAAIGQNNYLYVYSQLNYMVNPYVNYIGISSVSSLAAGGGMPSTPGLTVAQAYNIDKKMDDGLPQSGRAQSYYNDNQTIKWANNTTNVTVTPFTIATSGSVTSCFDNNGVAGTQQYSMTQNNGAGMNCALSFKMNVGN